MRLPVGEVWPHGMVRSPELSQPALAALFRRAADACDRLYGAGQFAAAEYLDALLEEAIDEACDRLEYFDVESWSMPGSADPEGETGIEDYELDETLDDLPGGAWSYWEPDMLAACDDGCLHGLAA